MQQVSFVLASLWNAIPPDIDRPSSADIWHLLKTARRFRALGRQDAFRLLRWLSMPAADLMEEWFETDLLRATLAAPGVSGQMLGPKSAGSALVCLLREVSNHLNGNARQVRGGPGALTEAMASAARAAGADIRATSTVERILVSNNRVTGVVVAGAEIPAAAVLSALDPKATFVNLLDPTDLSPDFVDKIRNYRARGTLAKVNLALSALPSFKGARNDSRLLTGRIHIGQDVDYLERAFDCAKYGQISDAPWLEVRIPSILDSTLAPRGGHVMSIYAHYAPFHLQGSTWEKERDTLLGRVLNTLDLFAPHLSDLIVARQVITPMDMEVTYGYSGGHIFHGELALDQLFAMRPVLGYARYITPVEGLFLCGAGTHPGGLMSGASGKWAAHRVVRSLKARATQGV
jgi:phytoene dehydrogenase-like protein